MLRATTTSRNPYYQHSSSTSTPGAVSTIADDTASITSGVSAITGLTGATGMTSRFPRAGTLIVNNTPDPHLLSLVPFNKKLKGIMGTKTTPNTDTEEPICLSFHVKGGCYSNCHRHTNHTYTLTQTNKQRLENYIADRLEQLNK